MKSKEVLNDASKVLFVIILCIHIGNCGWCTRLAARYEYRQVCCRWDWWHCNWWETMTHVTYYSERFCCLGWTGNDCNIPICDPPCLNGGVCSERPNNCKCDNAHTGTSCQTETCSYNKPCFPGTCYSNTYCQCLSGFGGQYCLNMSSTQQPHITHASTTMKYIPREGKFKGQLMYWFMSDASNPNSTETDHRWIHFEKFNELEYLVEAMYTPPDIMSLPNYVVEHKFGIVSGFIRTELSKVARTAGAAEGVFNKTYRYEDYTKLNIYNPDENVARLNITDLSFTSLIEHGDNLTIAVTVTSGGYEKVVNFVNQAKTEKQYFGQTASKTMVFHFDFEKPYHCSEDSSCSDLPIDVGADITKNQPKVSWKGWKDGLGGVFRFTVEIHRLKPDALGNLTEVSGMEPLQSFKMLKEEYAPPIRFSLTDPGMYSVILDVADAANNSRFSRQLLLFDNVSSVSLNDLFKLYVSSAEATTGYLWLNKNVTSDNMSPITVSWEGRFRNKYHEDNKLLNAVLRFSTTAMDGMYLKDVDLKLDDNSGRRTTNAIPNVHGIVKFEIVYKKDYIGGKTLTTEPENGWTVVPGNISETTSFNEQRWAGETIKIWVRATDIIGNTMTDSTQVHIDSTAPTITHAYILQNMNGTEFNYGSRIIIDTEDLESGVHMITWEIKYADNQLTVRSGSINGNRTKSNPGTEGSCTPLGDCYFHKHTIDINNCWMAVSKAKLQTQVFNIAITVYNMAMLKETRIVQVANLTDLAGMKSYAGPMNLRVDETYHNGVKIKWTPGYSCFNIQHILVTYSSESDKGDTMNIDSKADWYNLVGLKAGTNYTIKFVTEYADDSSDPVYISFVTATEEKQSNSAAVIGGSISAVIIILLVIIIILVLWRTRRLGRRKRPKNQYQQNITDIKQLEHVKVYNNKTYDTEGDMDDIYLYGGMKFETTPSWIIPSGKIFLEEKINSGRFADIFKARYDTKQNDKSIVVVKALQANFTQDDQLLMMAKINFFATQVGQHRNVINFIGAVTDNKHLGPYMVLEHCEEGNLRDWLLRNKEKVNDDTVERLYQMVLGVAKGMEYLSSKKIVHRRLAARNVLLPFTLMPKVAGFGPTIQDESKDKNDISKERVPVKWMAPECTEWTKNATTKSDVWSYGIVMWEILSFGETPYGGISSRSVPDKLEKGYRLERPEYSTDMHYKLMKKCWNFQPEGRPDFKGIAKDLESTFKTSPSDDYYYEMQKK